MQRGRPKLLPRKHIALLATESSAEFDELRAKVWRDIAPKGELERIYCDDFVHLCWDVLRLRRWKVAILNLARGSALYELLVEKLHELEPGQETVASLEDWFSSDEVRREVSEILEKHGLNESVIDAEAFRQCASELTLIEQLLAAAESRRAKAIDQIGLCREKLSRELQTIDVTPSETPRLSSRKASAG